MKPIYSYALLAALAAVSPALAVDATTTPVGYVTLAVPASGDTTIGQPLHRPPVFSGVSTGISGDTVNVGSGSFTASQFVYASPAQPNVHYILVKNGPLVGRYFEIESNTTDSLTVVAGATTLQDQGFTSTTEFTVIPYWTLNTLFPSGQGVGTTTADIFDPVAFVQFKNLSIGQDRAASSTYFYYSGTEEAGTGWYNNDDLGAGLQNDLIIDPSFVATVRNLQSTPTEVVVSGVVPSVTIKTPIITGSDINDNYVSTQLPVDISLAESGLSAVVTPATDIFSPVDVVFVYNDEASGYDKASSRTFFYYSGTEEAGTGWYDNDDLGAGLQDASKVLKAGRAYVARLAGGNPGTAQAATTIPYTL